MTKTWTIISCVIAAFTGAAIGAYVVLRVGVSMLDANLLSRAEGDLALYGGLLEHIHSGNLDAATQTLEIQTDGALITIDALVTERAKLSPRTYERLERIKKRRGDSAYRPDNELIAEAAERALQLHP